MSHFGFTVLFTSILLALLRAMSTVNMEDFPATQLQGDKFDFNAPPSPIPTPTAEQTELCDNQLGLVTTTETTEDNLQQLAQATDDTSDKLGNLTEDCLQHAMQNYAEHHSLPLSEVTKHMLAESNEGAAYWATLHDDFGSRSTICQQFGRAFSHRAPEEKLVFAKLDPGLKKKFKQEWFAAGKTWSFLCEKRIKTHSFEKTETDRGVYCNWITLCNHFGGYQYQDARDEAQIYAEAMVSLGNPYYVKNGVTRKPNFLFMQKVLTCKTKEDCFTHVTYISHIYSGACGSIWAHVCS